MKHLVCLMMVLLFAGDAFSKGFSGGGGRSFSSSRSSFSSGSKSSSFKPSTSKPSASKSSTSSNFKPTSSNKGSAAPRYKSDADKATYERAVKQGTVYKTREEAVSAFKTSQGSKYTSTFPKEPATRPSYIPQTVSSGGTTYNVTYNQSHGGYGYMNSLGTWIMFDALTDAITLNTLMNNHGYYGGSPYQAQTQNTPNAQEGLSVGEKIGYTLLALFCVGAVVVCCMILFE